MIVMVQIAPLLPSLPPFLPPSLQVTLLKLVKFQRVSSLTIFIESNNGADYTTLIQPFPPSLPPSLPPSSR